MTGGHREPEPSAEDPRSDQDQPDQRVRELEGQLADALEALARERAELTKVREHAAALAASLDESQARESALVEVVKAETARREQLSRQLGVRAEGDTRE